MFERLKRHALEISVNGSDQQQRALWKLQNKQENDLNFNADELLALYDINNKTFRQALVEFILHTKTLKDKLLMLIEKKHFAFDNKKKEEQKQQKARQILSSVTSTSAWNKRTNLINANDPIYSQRIFNVATQKNDSDSPQLIEHPNLKIRGENRKEIFSKNNPGRIQQCWQWLSNLLSELFGFNTEQAPTVKTQIIQKNTPPKSDEKTAPNSPVSASAPSPIQKPDDNFAKNVARKLDFLVEDENDSSSEEISLELDENTLIPTEAAENNDSSEEISLELDENTLKPTENNASSEDISLELDENTLISTELNKHTRFQFWETNTNTPPASPTKPNVMPSPHKHISSP